MAYTQEEIQQLFNALQFQPVGSASTPQTHLEIEGEVCVKRKENGEEGVRVYQAPRGAYTLVRTARDEYSLIASGAKRVFDLESHVWRIDGGAVVAKLVPGKEELYISGRVANAPYQASKVA